MTKNLIFVSETQLARLFRYRSGREVWIPRSVCRSVLKHPPNQAGERIFTIEVEDWFAEKNDL